jgi:hypothetical protein
VARSPYTVLSLRSSSINNVLEASGESLGESRPGNMLLQTPQGEVSIRGVQCVLTLFLTLMSESQVSECGGRMLISKTQASALSTEGNIILKGLQRDMLNVLDFSIARTDIAAALLFISVESQVMVTDSRRKEMELNLMHRRLSYPGRHVTRRLLWAKIALGARMNLTWCVTLQSSLSSCSVGRIQQLEYCPQKSVR